MSGSTFRPGTQWIFRRDLLLEVSPHPERLAQAQHRTWKTLFSSLKVTENMASRQKVGRKFYPHLHKIRDQALASNLAADIGLFPPFRHHLSPGKLARNGRHGVSSADSVSVLIRNPRIVRALAVSLRSGTKSGLELGTNRGSVAARPPPGTRVCRAFCILVCVHLRRSSCCVPNAVDPGFVQ